MASACVARRSVHASVSWAQMLDCVSVFTDMLCATLLDATLPAPCRCNATISLFQRSGRQPQPVVLGVCTGAEEPCGGLGERCCSHTDQAGWTWRVCGDGEPGVFCGADNVCARCPSTTTAEAGMSQAALAAMSLPGVGNTC